jgi:transcriptional regulator with XRE-family HTH domain
MRRKILGVSQERLAEDLGLTFQQVQKYERGANRVSASKLYEIAKSLQSSVSYFFEGLADPTDVEGFEENGSEQFVHDFLMTPEGLELAACSRASASPEGASAHPRSRPVDGDEDLIEEEPEA